MMKDKVTNIRLGVSFTNVGSAEVLVWAPKCEKVELELVADKTTLSLQQTDFGYWYLETIQIKPADQYVFILDGNGKKLPDPVSLYQPDGVHGPSEAVDLNEFEWTDASWQNKPLSDYLFYELHTGTFTDDGTFAGIQKKLDYLIELGITAIEIMPVAQFPGNRNWGYDGVFPYAVQNSYGGPLGLQQLVNVCHQKGIAVVLDVVYNHIGPEGNYFTEFGPYFTEKYNTPWGNAINFDDAWCDEVRKYFVENVLMWFRDFHIDALRMDAVHAIKDFSPKHILKEIKENVNDLMQATGKTHYLIVECDLNDNQYINNLSQDGFGMDAQWTDEFHHALRVTAGQKKEGYYSDFTGIKDLAEAYRKAYVYTGQYSNQRFKKFGTDPVNNSGQQFVVFSQNHDQVGNRMLGERTSGLLSFEMQKLMVAAVIVSPYLPMLFMGEEFAEENPFLYFVSHEDPELIEAVRKGRKEEFAAFHNEGEAPDPQDVETFNSSKIQWQLLEQEPHRAMFNYYKALIALRKNNPALNTLNRSLLSIDFEENKNILKLKRWCDEQQVICLMNFSDHSQTIALSMENKTVSQKIFDSADPVWKGPLASPTITTNELKLQPQSILIYSSYYA